MSAKKKTQKSPEGKELRQVVAKAIREVAGDIHGTIDAVETPELGDSFDL